MGKKERSRVGCEDRMEKAEKEKGSWKHREERD